VAGNAEAHWPKPPLWSELQQRNVRRATTRAA